MQLDEDMRLMMEAQKGDRQAYGRLYEKCAPVVRKYIARHSGTTESREDLVQEVFTRVWEHRGRYRSGMAICPYLLGFARNVHREHQARIHRELRVTSCEPDQTTDGVGPEPETIACRNDQAEEVRLYLARLPPKQRQALELVYLAGLSSKQVSRLLGCSDRTVRINCRMGLRKLDILLRNNRRSG